jgi:hypothetical protein
MKLFLAVRHLGACGLLADVGALKRDLSMIKRKMMRSILLWIALFYLSSKLRIFHFKYVVFSLATYKILKT